MVYDNANPSVCVGVLAFWHFGILALFHGGGVFELLVLRGPVYLAVGHSHQCVAEGIAERSGIGTRIKGGTGRGRGRGRSHGRGCSRGGRERYGGVAVEDHQMDESYVDLVMRGIH